MNELAKFDSMIRTVSDDYYSSHPDDPYYPAWLARQKNKEKRMSNVPKDAQERKDLPVARGVLDYFPLALLEVAHVSKVGNDQHNPGQPLHWARNKSTDHADCIVRHLLDRGKIDSDLVRHSAKVAWRALALLQEEMENEISEREV